MGFPFNIGGKKKRKRRSRSRNSSVSAQSEKTGQNSTMVGDVFNGIGGGLKFMISDPNMHRFYSFVKLHYVAILASMFVGIMLYTTYQEGINQDHKGVGGGGKGGVPVLYEKGVPHIPRSAGDLRMPVSALNDRYDLNDSYLEQKLSGVGKLIIDGYVLACTASLIGGREMVITASHCVTRDDGSPNSHDQLSFYLPACNKTYPASVVSSKIQSGWRERPDLDYALIRLAAPACTKAAPLQALALTDKTVQMLIKERYPLLSVSVFPFEEIKNHKHYPEERKRAQKRRSRLTAFGVFCIMKEVARFRSKGRLGGVGAAYRTQQCSTFPGNSGGPLLVSLDGGKTYNIIGTLYGSDGYESLFPMIKGGYAKYIEAFFHNHVGA